MPDGEAKAIGLTQLRAALDAIAREAGLLAHAMQKAGLKSWTKNGSSPVSEADIAANDLIRARLRVLTLDYGWLSEETEDDVARLDGSLTWIVDPIDGTRAFLAGREDWCVSIALVEGNVPVLASIYAPATNESFSAQRGQGATRNAEPLAADVGTVLDIARMAGPKNLIERLVRTSPAQAPHPRIGSLALRLCRVADGSLDVAFAGGHCHDWDIAAADLIVSEAGGRLTSLGGDAVRYNLPDVTHDTLMAAGRERHALIVARLRSDRD